MNRTDWTMESGECCGDAKNATWSDDYDLDGSPLCFKTIVYGFIAICISILIIVLPVVYSSSHRVPFENNAIIVSHNGKLKGDAGPGRRFSGPAGNVILFPRFDANVEYVGQDPITPRVRDGQIISIDLSFQYHIPRESLAPIYRLHKESFEITLRNLARSILRDEASKYASQEFFDNRTFISEQMRKRMVIEGSERLIKITGFQIRNVLLPKQLTDNLINVQVQRQEARARQEQLKLDKINADADALELSLKTEREKGIAEFEQATQVLLAIEIQKKRKIEERTNQLLTEISENTDRNVTIYTRETDILEEGINLEISIEEEKIRREVDELQITSETNLTIFNQNTENEKLAYENQVARIQSIAIQNVTRINSNTERRIQQFKRDIKIAVANAQKEARILIAEIKEAAANKTINSLRIALNGLPSSVYMADSIANGTFAGAMFVDVKKDSLLSDSLN